MHNRGWNESDPRMERGRPSATTRSLPTKGTEGADTKPRPRRGSFASIERTPTKPSRPDAHAKDAVDVAPPSRTLRREKEEKTKPKPRDVQGRSETGNRRHADPVRTPRRSRRRDRNGTWTWKRRRRSESRTIEKNVDRTNTSERSRVRGLTGRPRLYETQADVDECIEELKQLKLQFEGKLKVSAKRSLLPPRARDATHARTGERHVRSATARGTDRQRLDPDPPPRHSKPRGPRRTAARKPSGPN